MNKVDIPRFAIEAAQRRRGGMAVFHGLQPDKTAVVVVDMQVGFLQPGQVGECAHARDIVANVNAITAEARRRGVAVVFLRHTYDPQAAGGAWPLWSEYFMGEARREPMKAAFTRGGPGHDVDPALDRRPGDRVVDKTRFSAFIQGSSDLHAQLQALGIDTLIVTGTLTNVCCESTARDAMMLNYKVFFVSDATAAPTDEEHNGALAGVMSVFADVRSTDAILDLLRR